jgi:hypothetical protein
MAIETEPIVGAVSLKIPPFRPADPHIWFAQVEVQFCTRGISSEKTKFDHVVASLTPEYAQEIRDLILSPPTTTPYTTLKFQLIQRIAVSRQCRFQQLIHSEDLGDRRPTQLLRQMQQLIGDEITTTDDSFLRELFLQKLPASVRMVLASTVNDNLQELAELAAKVTEVAPPISGVASAHPSTSEITQLRSEVGELRKTLENLLSSSPLGVWDSCQEVSPPM